MKIKLLIILFMVAITLIAPMGCAEPVSGQVLKSDKPRAAAAGANTADATELVTGNSAFALDMYRKLGEKGGNLVFSPYSISQALAMTWAGAAGSTERDMAKAMRFTLPQAQLHPAFNSLDQELAKRQGEGKGKDGKGFRLNIVNAIWGQQGYKFLPAFLDTLAASYGAGLRTLDYKKAPEPSRLAINGWVKQQTEGRIVDLIPRGAIDPLTRLVLTNAIYFNAAWLSQFEKSATSDGDFHNLDGSLVKAPLMHHKAYYRYVVSGGYQAVELPYEGNQVSMLVIAPVQGFQEFEKNLDSARLATVLKDLKGGEVQLTMPSFKSEFDTSLSSALSALGMAVAFSGDADFSRMTGDRDLYISDAIHKAFIEVDESGTEAAAATAVIMRATAMPVQPVAITIDRPFIYLIRDIQTGTVLFLGRVVKL